VLSDYGRRGPLRGQMLCYQPVELDSSRPRDVAIEGIANERMSERHPAGRFLGDETTAKQLVGPRIKPGDCPYQLRIEQLARDSRCHGRGASILRKPGGS
jgi:hypothetical protein